MTSRSKLVVLIGVTALVLGAAVLTLALTNAFPFTSRLSTPSADGAFHVTVPRDWHYVKPQAVLPHTSALAALRQQDGDGLVVFARGGSANHLTGAFVVALSRELKRSSTDYKAVGYKIIEVGPANTRALLFTYERTARGELDSITIVPAGPDSYVIASAASESAPDTSREIGEIIHSFTLQ